MQDSLRSYHLKDIYTASFTCPIWDVRVRSTCVVADAMTTLPRIRDIHCAFLTVLSCFRAQAAPRAATPRSALGGDAGRLSPRRLRAARRRSRHVNPRSIASLNVGGRSALESIRSGLRQ